MKPLKITLILLFLMPLMASARLKTATVTISSDAGTNLFVDGKQVTAPVKIKIAPNATVNIRIEKVGFITQERNYTNNGTSVIPKTDYIKLPKDDAYENSFVTDLANQDIDIRASHNEDESWLLLNRIVTNSFDVIAITDKNTGYLCTAWSVKSFVAATIRTRLIIKTSSVDPLIYKAKLVSEIAPPGTSANADEAFRKWDRVLRSYENVIPDLQSRLGK